MATFSSTHPWITFSLDLRRAPWEFWLPAGEAVSKCEHLAGTPLQPETARELMTVYLSKAAHATTAIEGNTLTEKEVRLRIEGKLRLPRSKEYLGVEVDNVVAACNGVLGSYVAGESAAVTPEMIKHFNEAVLRGLTLDEHIRPGELRAYSVGVADYRGAPADDLPELQRRLCDWLTSPWIGELQHFETRNLEAILKAIVGHLYVAWIHPFGDGNGRTARLLEFFMLVRAGVPAPAAHLLSNHYNETRNEYYRQLSLSSKSGGDVMPFCMYALRGFVDQLREQIRVVRDAQWKLFWQNHVHQLLGDAEPQRRRQHLVLDLAERGEAVPKDKLTDLSPRVARDYARRNEKTLERDLAELERLDLIERVGDAYRARVEVVLAYLPPAVSR